MISLRWAGWPAEVGAAVGAAGGPAGRAAGGVVTDGRLEVAIPARDGLVLQVGGA